MVARREQNRLRVLLRCPRLEPAKYALPLTERQRHRQELANTLLLLPR